MRKHSWLVAGLVCAAVAATFSFVSAEQGRGGRASTPPGADGECPPGTTLVRIGSCQAPEFPAPSIVDYRPKSTLKSDEHISPKAKFPVIDLHGHPGQLVTSVDGIKTLVADMDKLNLRVMISADTSMGQGLTTRVNAVAASGVNKDRVRVLTGVSFANVGPDWAAREIARLETDIKNGAIGIGEVGKGFGLFTKKPDGTRLKIDDPQLDAFWDACARLGMVAFIHTAEPREFFSPLDMKNERWLELALFADRRHYMPGDVKFEELMTERNNMFRKHPRTKFVAAHFGYCAEDLKTCAKLLDEFPNVSLEVGAVLYDFGRQPRAAREFFIKYQDRILFGKDAWAPEEYPYYWRVFETKDEYFDYYRNYHAFWKLYGMDLPDEVLKKLYYKNALKLMPGLPQDGWPK
jgi:predicted TIM-barrel fold metal-dependent hydrolase